MIAYKCFEKGLRLNGEQFNVLQTYERKEYPQILDEGYCCIRDAIDAVSNNPDLPVLCRVEIEKPKLYYGKFYSHKMTVICVIDPYELLNIFVRKVISEEAHRNSKY